MLSLSIKLSQLAISPSLLLCKTSFTIEVLTAKENCDRMEPQRNSPETVESNNISKEGERGLLRCSKVDRRSPSLDFNSNDPIISDEVLIDFLASILVEGFLGQHHYGTSEETSSHLLPGIH